MTSDAAPAKGEWSGQLWLVLGIWLVVAAWMTWHSIPNIREWTFPDPDDAMRLIQVRDWLAGQSWFDVTQYRLNPPAGGPMHWSRLVDLPIAAVILGSRWFLGEHGAETAALVIVPLVTLGIAMLLVHRIAFRLMDGPAALLAVFATPASLGAMKQMKILRIDHHGWQIVLALVALLAIVECRPRRAGIVAGLAMATWLNISIEGLPFGAAIAGWFAIQWLRDASAGEALESYLAALALGSAMLFGATHAPSVWFAHPHDVLNIAHLVGFTVGALCCRFAVRKNPGDVRIRLGALAAAGFASLVAMFAVDPHFLQPPFASLDPMVKTLWYDGVDEGQPIWRLSADDAAAGLAQPLVGLLGAFLALKLTRGEQRARWLAFTFYLCAAALAGVFVIREATTASVLSLPGTAFLCDAALRRARKVGSMPVRAIATSGALFIMAPAYAAPALVMPQDPQLVKAWHSSDLCETRSEIEKLDALPASNLAVPLDITPAILASSPHRAIASGYHRNGGGIKDVIILFSGTLGEAREIIARRKIDYVVFCPDTPEALRWANRGPNGLSAMLNANRSPGWLEPVHLQGLRALRVWRVRKDLLQSAPQG